VSGSKVQQEVRVRVSDTSDSGAEGWQSRFLSGRIGFELNDWHNERRLALSEYFITEVSAVETVLVKVQINSNRVGTSKGVSSVNRLEEEATELDRHRVLVLSVQVFNKDHANTAFLLVVSGKGGEWDTEVATVLGGVGDLEAEFKVVIPKTHLVVFAAWLGESTVAALAS